MALNFLIYHGDKVKNTLIESGKDVYNRIIEENQEIFTSRKRGISKKGGSELPMLFFWQTVQMIITKFIWHKSWNNFIVNNFKKELNPWILGLTISTTENLDYLTLLCTCSLMQSIYTFLWKHFYLKGCSCLKTHTKTT